MFCKDGAVLDVEAPRIETIDTTKTFRIPSQNLVKREYMFSRVKDKLLVSMIYVYFNMLSYTISLRFFKFERKLVPNSSIMGFLNGIWDSTFCFVLCLSIPLGKTSAPVVL